MDLPLQLTFRGLDHSDALAEYIRTRADKLPTFHPRVTACRVTLEAPHQHKHEGRPYRVLIHVAVPGDEIVVSHDVGEDVRSDAYSAIDAAFDDAQRCMQDHARVQRGDVKAHERALHGVVAKLFAYEGYGFIRTENGEELYFHKNSVVHGAFDRMAVGARVRYTEATGEDGIHASTVTLLRKHGGKVVTKSP